jgi:hypothetical protein
MRRRELIALFGASVAWPFAAMAQQPGGPIVSAACYWRRGMRLLWWLFSTNCAATVSLKGKTSRLSIAFNTLI